MFEATHENPLVIVVLISGNGSNLQAIIDYIEAQALPVTIKAVISNTVDAYGLTRAKQAGIDAQVVNHKDYATREEFDQALQICIDAYQPDLILLAGFMRILTQDFVTHFRGKMINIHPSLLPKYQGLNTHKRVLESDDQEHGVSVHLVTPELDAGPVILQKTVPIYPDDSIEVLADRVHQQEYIIYPMVLKWFVEGRVEIKGDHVWLDNQPIPCHSSKTTIKQQAQSSS
jgi:phosphoribosylglycinamide formyltransferase-1